MKRIIDVQAAVEMEFKNKILHLEDESGSIIKKELNGFYYVAEAYGITGGTYMVYYKNQNFASPDLIINLDTWQDMTNKVMLCRTGIAEEGNTIAALYMTESLICDSNAPINGIANQYVKGNF